MAISGPAGSGKTTLAGLLSESLGIPLISTGLVFRQMAAERGMDVLQFNLAAEKDHAIDRELDMKIVEEARGMGQCIVESRLACLMLGKGGLEPFCIYVDAAEEIRASRIAERDGMDGHESLQRMRAREESEHRRYMDIYGMDPSDRSAYDLVVDSGSTRPEELLRLVMEHMRAQGVL